MESTRLTTQFARTPIEDWTRPSIDEPVSLLRNEVPRQTTQILGPRNPGSSLVLRGRKQCPLRSNS